MKQISLRSLLIVTVTFLLFGCKKDEPIPKPIADFSITYEANGVVTLNNQSSRASSYQWSISNGYTTTEVSPRMQFPANGNYTATLVAKGDGGTDTATQTITINNIPTQGSVVFWTTANTRITVTVNGVNLGQTTVFYSGNVGPACGTAGNVTCTLPGGTYPFTGKSNDIIPATWSGTITVINGQCRTQLLYKQ